MSKVINKETRQMYVDINVQHSHKTLLNYLKPLNQQKILRN